MIAINKVVGILLVILVIIFVVIGFGSKLREVIAPVLGWEVDLTHVQSNIALIKVHNLYTQCNDAGKSDCFCKGGELIAIDKDDRIKIGESEIGNGIRIDLVEKLTNKDFRIVGGSNFCRYPIRETFPPTERINPPLLLYYVNNQLMEEGNEFLSDFANPLVIYKWNDGDKACLSLLQEIYVPSLGKESCF